MASNEIPTEPPSPGGHQQQQQQQQKSQEEEENLKAEFEQLLGPAAFHAGWSSLLSVDPGLFGAGARLAAVPRRRARLGAKAQSLVALAVDSAATHLYAPGIRAHAGAALAAGASAAEVLEVVALASTLGIHACNVGVPVLVEVLRERKEGDGEGEEDVTTRPYDERQEALKQEFARKRGYWHGFWEDFLRLDPEFFEAYLEFSSLPWTRDASGKGEGGQGGRGALEPKMKELVYCAFDAAATHLYVPGLKLHMRNALGYGATPEEILEVLEIATLLSLHTAHVAVPIIEELLSASSGST
ncbi:AhpD-like protein [Biscogniauxia mediterranea]|nr:AhpD-like protein [Biscogniauxia mediterranea]